jgi:hypothetical protein
MNNEFSTLQKYVECFVGMWDDDIGICRVTPIQDGIIIECGDADDVMKAIETKVKSIQVIKNVNIDVKYKHNNATITILFDSNLLQIVGNVIRDNLNVLSKNNLIGFIQTCRDDFSVISLGLSFADDCNYDTSIDWEVEFNILFEEILLDTLVSAKVIANEDRAKYNQFEDI